MFDSIFIQAGKVKASLLLVDRTLDMASACGHHTETLVDRIVRSLPKLEGHANDVRVNMAPLCSVPRYSKRFLTCKRGCRK